MKTAYLFKVLGDCPDTHSTPDALIRHANRKKGKDKKHSEDLNNAHPLFALRQAV